jgi:hypothetical protein
MSPLHPRNYVIDGHNVRLISNYADLMPNVYWRGLLASSKEGAHVRVFRVSCTTRRALENASSKASVNSAAIFPFLSNSGSKMVTCIPAASGEPRSLTTLFVGHEVKGGVR